MLRTGIAIGIVVAFGMCASVAGAADNNKSSWPRAKAGPGEKVCKYKFPTGEKRAWVCKKEEPCCAWDAINYVKCGSTITGCL